MVQMNSNSKASDPRAGRREARRRRLRLIAGDRPVAIKVWAANETMREVLRHPKGGRFRDTIDQSVEWPNDSFTTRRIADGSVRTDGPGAGEEQPADPALNAREQSAARKAKNQAPKETSNEAPKEASRNGPSKRSAPTPEPPSAA